MAGFDAAAVWPILLAIVTLVVLEGLLSADNALVLAVMVRHLPKHEQKRALRYGIWGAFVFRFIAVIFAAKLLDYWQLKVAGGLYLLYLAVSRLLFGEAEQESGKPSRFGSGFWATVAGVELADIAFSIDSILAAVAMTEGLPAKLNNLWFGPLPLKLWVVYIGGVLGIVMMRFVAGLFLILLRRFVGLAAGAYVLVAWIGLELVGGGFHTALHPPPPAKHDWFAHVPAWAFKIPLEMPDWLFWTGMGVIVLLSLLYKPPDPKADEEGLVEIGKAAEEPNETGP
ncbi:MAG TPA: TerC family protein [Isosphaeraceae bacterium]|jgi:YkoY family integral membrane protein|nr:TerC family protein [Isosphaeraceae bacterium]